MSQHDVKDKPYPFAGAGHSMGWKCIRCAQPRPMLGSRRVRFKGLQVKVCGVCVAEMAS